MKRREHDTPKKTRFYKAFDERGEKEGLRSISRSENIPRSTAQLWLHQRNILGNAALRRVRPQAKSLGRKEKVLKETYSFLISDLNPVRNKQLDYQVNFLYLNVTPRTIQRGLKRHTNGAERFKQVYINKKLRAINKRIRVKFGKEYQDKTVEDF